MLRALMRLFGVRPRDGGAQLTLDFEAPPPRTADELLARLREHGLQGISRCRLTRNRAVMVSYKGGELRIHEGYLAAPPAVLQAVVAFVGGRTRAARREAQRVILAFRIERPAAERPAPRARERTRPEDEPLARTLAEHHARLNAQHFGGQLGALPVRVSRRLRTRLGHYAVAAPDGEGAEIVIGYRHIRRHGWEEALHTLLHEMVHQWQDEVGLPVDHGRAFRAKARSVGITPAARRAVGVGGGAAPPRAPRAPAGEQRTDTHPARAPLAAASPPRPRKPTDPSRPRRRR